MNLFFALIGSAQLNVIHYHYYNPSSVPLADSSKDLQIHKEA